MNGEGANWRFSTAFAVLLGLMLLSAWTPGFHLGPGPGSVSAEGNEALFTVSYDDDRGDVRLVAGNSTGSPGDALDNADIVELYSEPVDGGGDDGGDGIDVIRPGPLKGMTIALSVRVAGLITDSAEYLYQLSVQADDEDYLFQYYMGVCTEFNSDRPYPAAGAGTDTLVINVTEDDLGEPDESFDISSICYHIPDPEGSEVYIDTAPTGGGGEENKVEVVSPTPGSTVTGEIEVRGVAQGWELELTTVEFQIDGTADSGWVEAHSRDGWNTFSFTWDTNEYPELDRVVNVRARNETREFLTSVSYWVDRDLETDPPVMDRPAPRLGDVRVFREWLDVEEAGMQVTYETEKTSTLMNTREVNVSGQNMTCLQYYVEGRAETEVMGFNMDIEEEGIQWVRVEDFALVKDDLWENVSYMGLDVNAHSTVIYDPPFERFVFPMAVGDSWVSTSKFKMKAEADDPLGGDPIEETVEGEESVESQVLRLETVTVEAGQFSCFVIRQETVETGDEESTSIDHSLIWFNRSTASIVREASYDSSGALVHTMELIAFEEGDGEPVVIDTGDDEPIPPSMAETTYLPVALTLLLLCIVAGVAVGGAQARKRRRGRTPVKGGGSAVEEADAVGEGELFNCPGCGEDFDINRARRGGRSGMIKCPNCGIEGRME